MQNDNTSAMVQPYVCSYDDIRFSKRNLPLKESFADFEHDFLASHGFPIVKKSITLVNITKISKHEFQSYSEYYKIF
jgi:hypothetical protein